MSQKAVSDVAGVPNSPQSAPTWTAYIYINNLTQVPAKR